MYKGFSSVDFKNLINSKMKDESNTIYVLKGFGDLSFDAFKNVKLYSVDFETVLNENRIDFQLIIPEVWNKLMTKKSFVLSYEEYCACVDTIGDFFEINLYKIVVINNNLFHNYYPLANHLNRKSLIDQIDEEKDTIINRIFLEYIIVKNNVFIEYSGFDNYESLETEDLFEVHDFDFDVIENEECDRYSFGMTDVTYLELLFSLLNLDNKEVNISVESSDFLPFQKNLLSILITSLNFKITIVKRITKRIEDDHTDDYLSILKRKNPKYLFRNIQFYNNPGFSLETSNISQAEIISALTINALNASNGEDYNDIFVTAPTGSGKSVLFQIPAIYMAEKHDLLTIIITPLIGLMNDQVQNIQTMTSCAATINSEYTPGEKSEICQGIIEKRISILYISPETLLSNNPISNLIGDRKIGLLIVDEAHIVSTWGKSFRPDYWFLGDYISYLRTKLEYRFPIATFSATITYGGNDDMHGDIIDSLKMKTGDYEYIAPMRRDDIKFNINVWKKENDYLKEKDSKVLDSLNTLLKQKSKTIVYFPYKKHVDDYYKKLSHSSSVARYHGGITKLEKDESASSFKNGNILMILSTKAFGMGIDIDDIETVYHYSPTGNLCDYVQEIGRAARNDTITGIAKTDFFENDYRYIKQLFGMSSIKNHQIVETLKKIKEIYITRKQRNFTVSPDEFSYIFPSSGDMQSVDNAFKTVMLMIQKDFEKNPQINFKPIIFKPRSIFTKGYFLIKEEDLLKLKRTAFFKYFKLFSTAAEMASKDENHYTNTYFNKNTLEVTTVPSTILVAVTYIGNIFAVDFKKMWEENFNNLSFSQFKYNFFTGELENFKLSENFIPEYLLTIVAIKSKFEDVVFKLEKIMNYMINEFSRPNIEKSQIKIIDVAKIIESNGVVELNYYESLIAAENFIEFINKYETANSFGMQRIFKYNASTDRYTIFSINLLKKRIKTLINDVKYKFSPVLQGSEKVLLLDLKNNKKIQDSKELLIAQILEMFRLSTYQVVSGERPEYFIRVNSISQIDKIVDNHFYRSEMVRLVKYRHEQSIKIMNEFFTVLSDDKKRWDYIEKYFAGFVNIE